MELLIQLLVNGCVYAGIYSVLAIGFGILYRALKFFYVAYGASFVATLYFIIFLNKYSFSFISEIFLSLIFSIFLGFLFEILIYRNLDKRKVSSILLFIASLGLYIIVVNLISMFFGNNIQIINQSINNTSFTLGKIIITKIQIIQFITSWLITIIFWLLIRKNTFIKSLWVIGDNPDLVKILGLPYSKIRIFIFCISSLFSGIGAILIALDIGIHPYLGMHIILTSAVAVIIGGIDFYWGWIIGSLLISFLHTLSIWKFSPKWNDLITFSILIIVLLYRPYGILTSEKRLEE